MSFEKTLERFKLPGSVKDVISKLNERYDDVFTQERMISFSPLVKGRRMLVRSEKYPDKSIYVEEINEDGEQIITDTYLQVKFSRLIVETFTDYLNQVFASENKFVFYQPSNSLRRSDGNSEITFETFAKADTTLIPIDSVVFCNVDEVDVENVKNQINKLITESGYKMRGCIRLLKLDCSDEGLDEENYQMYVSKNKGEKMIVFDFENGGETK